MSGRSARRRGMTMVFAVLLTVAAGVLLAVLSLHAALRARESRLEDLRAVHATVRHSAVGYAASRMAAWRVQPPAGSIELDVAALLPAGTARRATISFEAPEAGGVCRLTMEVRRGRLRVSQCVDLPRQAPAGSRPS